MNVILKAIISEKVVHRELVCCCCFVSGEEEGYQDVTLSLKRDGSLNGTGAQEWWDISIADCNASAEACKVLPMVIFNDKVSPPSLGFLAGYG